MTFRVTARSHAFEPGSLTIPAGSPVTILFENADTGIEHNFSLTIEGTAMESCTGPCQLTQTFTSPEPGIHAYFCYIHPGMFGFLTIE